jgi:hypothetical protein
MALPDALSTNVPVVPEEEDQDKVALAVPEKLIVEEDPGHRVVEEVSVAVGAAFTVIVPVALTEPQPPVRGMVYA